MRKFIWLAVIIATLLTSMFLVVNVHASTPVSETVIPTPNPIPTSTPTPKVMPGSPLSLGGQSFAEAISQFDITQLANLVLITLGIMWAIVVLVYVGWHFRHKKEAKK